MAQFKGSVFASTRDFTEQRFGHDGFARVLAELSREDAELLSCVTHMGWYPVEPVLRYHHALDRTFGTGNLELCAEAGRFSAAWAVNGILKAYVRLRSPHWLMDKATSVWRHYHDTGRWEFGEAEPKRSVGRLHDFGVRDPAFCARLRGWLEGAMSLSGGKLPKVVETRCACRTGSHCEFDCRWT